MAQKAAFGHKGKNNNTRTIKSWMYWCILKGWYDARMPVVTLLCNKEDVCCVKTPVANKISTITQPIYSFIIASKKNFFFFFRFK